MVAVIEGEEEAYGAKYIELRVHRSEDDGQLMVHKPNELYRSRR